MTARKTTTTRGGHNVTEVWEAIDTLKTDVTSIKTDMAAMQVGHRSIESKLDQVIDQQTTNSKPQYPLILALLGFIFTFMTAAAGTALAPLYLADSYSSEDMHNHDSLEGHPEAMIKTARLEKDVQRIDGNVNELKELLKDVNEQSEARHELAVSKVEALDTNLQREMRDLDKVQETRITSLDDILQREMRFIDDIQSAKREALSERVSNNEKHLQGRDGLRFNMPDFERMVSPKLNDLEERMLSVEKSRFTATDSEAMKQLQLQQAERISRLEAELQAAVGKIDEKLRVTPSDVLNEVKRRGVSGEAN